MKESKYLLLIIFHIVIAVLIYYIRPLSLVYAICIPIVGLYYVIKTQNKGHEVLYVAAYIVGSEVFLTQMNAKGAKDAKEAKEAKEQECGEANCERRLSAKRAQNEQTGAKKEHRRIWGHWPF